jgi:hypothetical protein
VPNMQMQRKYINMLQFKLFNIFVRQNQVPNMSEGKQTSTL